MTTIDALLAELTTLRTCRDLLDDVHRQLVEDGDVDPYTMLSIERVLNEGGE